MRRPVAVEPRSPDRDRAQPRSAPARRVVAVANLEEFFHDNLHHALERQRLCVEDQTEHYVVQLLTLFSRSEALYERSPGGPRIKPLVAMLAEALEAHTAADRQRGLKRLGDVSLFVAGFFSGSFARKLIDIDYHIAMGGRAYRSLAETLGRGHVLAQVFAELAQKFQPLVDALADLSESSREHTDADILRLYEIWLKTGSRRAYRLLGRLGVAAAPSARTPQ